MTVVAVAVNQQVLVEDDAGSLGALDDAWDDDSAHLELLNGNGIDGNLLKAPRPEVEGPALEDLVDITRWITELGHIRHNLHLLGEAQGGLGELKRQDAGEDLQKLK